MNTHTTILGETIAYPPQAPEVDNFIAKAMLAANDPGVSINDMIELLYGLTNPILDKDFLPGRAMVTKAVFDNPVYHVLTDTLERKRVQLGRFDPQAARQQFTMTVAGAAAHLGISAEAVRLAIRSKRLAAIHDGGEWRIDPRTVASYRVSQRGPKGKGPRKQVEPTPEPSEWPVVAQLGGVEGGSLSAKLESGDIIRLTPRGKEFGFPREWTRAAVRLTASGKGVRVFVLEPAPSEATIEHLGLTIRGQFAIAKKFNSTKAANEAWKVFGREKIAT